MTVDSTKASSKAWENMFALMKPKLDEAFYKAVEAAAAAAVA